MRVLCITKNGFTGNGPTFGEVLEVAEELENSYKLMGYVYANEGFISWYPKKSFIPLSEIDETELLTQRKPRL